jgi:hypothetical protein
MHPFTTLDLEDCDALVRMHNEQILKQCEYVYSNKPLEDGEVEGYRTMALQELKIVSW